MKERIEKAIETITGLIMEFTDAEDGLREVRELLYEFLENEGPDDYKFGQGGQL